MRLNSLARRAALEAETELDRFIFRLIALLSEDEDGVTRAGNGDEQASPRPEAGMAPAPTRATVAVGALGGAAISGRADGNRLTS